MFSTILFEHSYHFIFFCFWVLDGEQTQHLMPAGQALYCSGHAEPGYHSHLETYAHSFNMFSKDALSFLMKGETCLWKIIIIGVGKMAQNLGGSGFSQRTQVCVPAPALLTMVWNSNSKGSSLLVRPQHYSHMGLRHTYR